VYFLAPPTEEFAALSADSLMVSNNKHMKLVWFVIFVVFIKKYRDMYPQLRKELLELLDILGF
jgi:hypothetical protein